ncbi:unnamed protein product [Blepharisma stoltei]|uniref:Transmembrane protein n=1 Tax=Blepharisma stoltei TaxID=1481888 RepID=A0AAU9IAZ8_9CILI|nr:unnamed protein product [Blepharisma stoltei]
MLCCFDFNGSIGQNNSQQLSKLFKILKYIFAAQIIYAVLELVRNPWNSIMMFIGALNLYFIIKYRNWCNCVIYILITLTDFLTLVLFTLDSIGSPQGFGGSHLFEVFLLTKVPFYLISMYYCYLTYKEVKAIYITENRGNFEMNSSWNQRNQGNYQPPPPSAPHYFEGRGHRLD